MVDVLDASELRCVHNAPQEEIDTYQGAICWRNLADGRVIVLYELDSVIQMCIGWQMDAAGYRGWCYPKDKIAEAIVGVITWDGNNDPPAGWLNEVGMERSFDGKMVLENEGIPIA